MSRSRALGIAAWLVTLSEVAYSDESHSTILGEIAASTMLIDRGEQLSAETLELTATLEQQVSTYRVYLSGYMIKPIGSDADAFEQEIDYTVGTVWSGPGYTADLSANFLTYPGGTSTHSIELANEISLDAPLSPVLQAFYDTRSHDWGLAVEAGPKYTMENWELYTIGRFGFVDAGSGASSRLYFGAEIGASVPLGEDSGLELYARYERADESTFLKNISGGIPADTVHSGVALGLRLNSSL